MEHFIFDIFIGMILVSGVGYEFCIMDPMSGEDRSRLS